MEDQEKIPEKGESAHQDQPQIQQTSLSADTAKDSRGVETHQTGESSGSVSQGIATKRPLTDDTILKGSDEKIGIGTVANVGAVIGSHDVSNKRLKSGSPLGDVPETPATTPTTPSTFQSSNMLSTTSNKNDPQSDTNYSIAREHSGADEPPATPPTPPPSAASTATNSSSVAPSASATVASEATPVFSPRKTTSLSSFDSGNCWTDDDAYERMPKTPVAPPQKSSARKAMRHSSMSPLPGASGVFLPDVPPAPPTTPAPKATSVLSFQGDLGLATPLPYTAGFVQNTNQLEQQQRHFQKSLKEQQLEQQRYQQEQQRQQELQDGAATPAPPRSQQQQQTGGAKPPSARSQTLSDDFSEWAVGDRYKLSRMLGRGSYGEVAQAIDLYQGRPDAFVAIKRIVGPFDQEVDAVRLFREIHILRRLRTLGKNDCIVPLLDVVQPPTDDLNDFHDLYLVFDYVDTDLYKLIMSPQYLTTEHIQTFLYQMLIGLKYIHSGNVIHRDLKPANILLNEDCSLKICDFGLARIVDEISVAQGNESTTANTPSKNSGIFQKSPPVTETSPRQQFIARSCSISEGTLSRDDGEGNNMSKLPLTRQLTKHVVTRWYRAPELILIQPYTTAVDVWSLGCIFAELLSMQEGSVPGYQDRTPLFPGGACYPLSGDADNAERLDQLNVIFNVIGTPSKEDIANIGTANEYIKTMKPIKPKSLKDIYPAADPNALDLLQNMLKFNPKQRCTASEALDHKFFEGIRRKEMETSVESPMESPEFLNEQEIDIETLKQKAYNEVLWFRDNQSRPSTLTSTQTEEHPPSQEAS